MKINLDFIYPIGSLYLTTNTIDPNVIFGGTWEKISNDAYLKIASGDTAGNLNGTSSDHKIPVSSMPSHGHPLMIHSGGTLNDTGGVGGTSSGTKSKTLAAGATWGVQNAGGGQAYYPYYYDVFVWKRTA